MAVAAELNCRYVPVEKNQCFGLHCNFDRCPWNVICKYHHSLFCQAASQERFKFMACIFSDNIISKQRVEQ